MKAVMVVRQESDDVHWTLAHAVQLIYPGGVCVCLNKEICLWSPLSSSPAQPSILRLHVVLQVGPEVAKQVFEEHVEKLKAKEKERKHRDDDDEGGGKKKKRSSRCSGCGGWGPVSQNARAAEQTCLSDGITEKGYFGWSVLALRVEAFNSECHGVLARTAAMFCFSIG